MAKVFIFIIKARDTLVIRLMSHKLHVFDLISGKPTTVKCHMCGLKVASLYSLYDGKRVSFCSKECHEKYNATKVMFLHLILSLFLSFLPFFLLSFFRSFFLHYFVLFSYLCFLSFKSFSLNFHPGISIV